MKPEEIHDVPGEDVPNVVKGFILSGAKKIIATKQKQKDGRWTVKAS